MASAQFSLVDPLRPSACTFLPERALVVALEAAALSHSTSRVLHSSRPTLHLLHLDVFFKTTPQLRRFPRLRFERRRGGSRWYEWAPSLRSAGRLAKKQRRSSAAGSWSGLHRQWVLFLFPSKELALTLSSRAGDVLIALYVTGIPDWNDLGSASTSILVVTFALEFLAAVPSWLGFLVVVFGGKAKANEPPPHARLLRWAAFLAFVSGFGAAICR